MKIVISKINVPAGIFWAARIDWPGAQFVKIGRYKSMGSAKRGAAKWLARMGGEINRLSARPLCPDRPLKLYSLPNWSRILQDLEARGMIEVVK